jgi:hypothetical protein
MKEWILGKRSARSFARLLEVAERAEKLGWLSNSQLAWAQLVSWSVVKVDDPPPPLPTRQMLKSLRDQQRKLDRASRYLHKAAKILGISDIDSVAPGGRKLPRGPSSAFPFIDASKSMHLLDGIRRRVLELAKCRD